jgi:hypothetical protein
MRTLQGRRSRRSTPRAFGWGELRHIYVDLHPTFLREQLGFSWADAGLAAYTFSLGALVGLPAGWLGDRLDQWKIIISTLLAGSVIDYLLFNGPTSLGDTWSSDWRGGDRERFLFVNICSSMQRAVRPSMIGRASGLRVASLFIPASVAGCVFLGLAAAGWGGAALSQLDVLPLVAVVLLLGVDTQRFSHARLNARS